jgi:hypothetical protein
MTYRRDAVANLPTEYIRRLRDAAKLCRDLYCAFVPGKRRWEELSLREQAMDMLCIHHAMRLATP